MTRTDLIVLSHLRWNWVWQRPQHLISRLAAGRRTWFVEEPVGADVSFPTLRIADAGPVKRVWLEVPGAAVRLDFGAPGTEQYLELLQQALGSASSGSDVWLYTPMALDIAEALEPRVLVYDVMDDLASFAGAAESMRTRQRRALESADIVFAGGRSLYRSVVERCGPGRVHLFRSGVETSRYARARALRRRNDRPVAGYVGVVDERLDFGLIAGLASALPGWEVRMIGPLAKMHPRMLPLLPNLRWLGNRHYEELPSLMAGLEVALMPFALNEATRSISPTKTLEYLAAGLPVVSTRIPDVVADFGGVVHLADDAAAFAAACLSVIGRSNVVRDSQALALTRKNEWDVIVSEMAALIEQVLEPAPAEATGEMSA